MEKSSQETYQIIQSPAMVKRLSDEAYNTPEEALDELVQNAKDADAKNVNIMINSEKIIVEDDGVGFNKERREAFFTQATDYKVRNSKNKIYAGNKGIGRYAIFKLAEKCEVRTKEIRDSAYIWVIEDNNFIAGSSITCYSSYWNKPNYSGTEFVMTKLRSSGKDLYERIDKLKQLIIRNWDLENINIRVNGQLLKPENINYEEKFKIIFKDTVNNIYIKGEAGLTDKEGNINGILIKVNGRGVGKPRLFGIENMGRYGMLIPRLRGVLHINGFNNKINISRNNFIEDKEYESVIKHIKLRLVKEILEMKLRNQEKNKMNNNFRAFRKFINKYQHVFDKIFGMDKTTFKNPHGDHEFKDQGELIKFMDEGIERSIPHDEPNSKQKEKPSKDIIRSEKTNKKQGGNLRIGNYNWKFNFEPKGSQEKLIVIDEFKLLAVINQDHPSFKKYMEPKNFLFLLLDFTNSALLSRPDLYNRTNIREILDQIQREIIK